MKIFVFLLCLLPFSLFSQVRNFRIGADLLVPVIPSVESNPEIVGNLPGSTGYSSYYASTAAIKETYSAKTGAKLSGTFEVTLSKRIFFSSGLSLSWTNFQRKLIVEKINSPFPGEYYNAIVGNPTSRFYGYIVEGVYGTEGPVFSGNPRGEDLAPVTIENAENIGKTTLINLQIPTLVGMSFAKSKLMVRSGVVTSLVLHASTHKLNLLKTEKQTTTDEFTTISLGAMVSVGLNFTPKWGVEVAGQHYFNPLYKSEYQTSGKARLNLLSAGINYRFMN